MKIKILKKSELTGTQYFEFMVGKHDGKSCRFEDSIYLQEGVISFFEGTILGVDPTYDHFQFNFLDHASTKLLKTRLENLRDSLEHTDNPESLLRELAAGADRAQVSESSLKDPAVVCDELSIVAMQLADWVEDAEAKGRGISILGM